MSDPIQSISQSNYILHNIDAKKLYVQEPLFTANSGDAVYVGWRPDETVLYSATNSTATFTTIEAPSNFEYLRVHYTRGGNMGYVSLVEPNDNYITYGGLIYDVNEGSHLQEVAGCVSSTNGLNWVVAGQNRRWNNGTTGVNGNTTTGQHYITKIVGCNRKENA